MKGSLIVARYPGFGEGYFTVILKSKLCEYLHLYDWLYIQRPLKYVARRRQSSAKAETGLLDAAYKTKCFERGKICFWTRS